MFPVGGTDVPPLSSQSSPHKDLKKASRLGRAFGTTANLSDQAKIDGVRRAAIEVYCTDDDLTDGEALALYDYACRNDDGEPRQIRSVKATWRSCSRTPRTSTRCCPTPRRTAMNAGNRTHTAPVRPRSPWQAISKVLSKTEART